MSSGSCCAATLTYDLQPKRSAVRTPPPFFYFFCHESSLLNIYCELGSIVCCEETVPKTGVLRCNSRYVTETDLLLIVSHVLGLCVEGNAWNVHSEQTIMSLSSFYEA
jgi:hypothetical protein